MNTQSLFNKLLRLQAARLRMQAAGAPNLYNFPADMNYYFVTRSIPKEFGGLTRALLRRAKAFGEQAGVKVNVVTFLYNADADVRPTMWRLEREGLLNRNYTTVLNMYDFYRGKMDVPLRKIHHPAAEPGCTLVKHKTRNAYLLFKNGLYVMFKSYERKDGRLKFIDYIDTQRKRTKREEFNSYGRMHKTIYYDYEQRVNQELFYNSEGHCYLAKWYDIKEEESTINSIHWFSHDGKVHKKFKSEEDMQVYWLEQLVKREGKHAFVVDNRHMDPIVLKAKGDFYKISLFHSAHIYPPFQPHSPVKAPYRPIFEELEQVDSMVFLTNVQKQDIAARTGDRDNFFVIPHTYENSQPRVPFAQRALNRAAILARYSGHKQLDHAIRAFKLALEQNPNIYLDLYGHGEEEQKLRNLIDELGVAENVSLKGFAKDIKQVLETSAFTIITSKSEGFCLSILESLAHGCPVISYDTKYGPADMIQNGHNGYLVEANNIEELGRRIHQLFANPNELERLSQGAYDSAQTFNERVFLERWSHLFRTLADREPASRSAANQ
ncbi:glycosyltransferase [Ectobacillus ponti]|uniref:Glycosyltransferase n=1 Tax=Ectobacillus ponti TaxID=2961894 RepID=A0AA41XCV3_9BACI|nr:glycosyltransferase [Ectobacillus ponti]MCP8971343.1 glycosyltransferase [Ectobacillus ponti]